LDGINNGRSVQSNRALRRIFGPKWDVVSGGWIKIAASVVIKSRIVTWAEYVEFMREMRFVKKFGWKAWSEETTRNI
jgi:hypothetical protein